MDIRVSGDVESTLRPRPEPEDHKRLIGPTGVSIAAFVAAVTIAFCYTDAAFAHALGNNTVNRQAALQINANTLQLRYLVDMAEIPTISESQAADVDQDGQTSDAEWDAYTKRWAQELVPYLRLEFNRQRLPLKLESQHWSLQSGSAGLDILRLEARLSAPLTHSTQTSSLQYQDDHKPDELGWKEIWVSANGGASVTRTSAALTDRSHGLTEFPVPLGASPPNELTARAEVVFEPVLAEPPAARPKSNGAEPKRDVQAPATRTSNKPSSGTPLGAVDPQTPTRVPNVAHTDAAHTANTAPPLNTMNQDRPPFPGSAVPVSWAQQAWPFFKLGMHHIGTGWDHLMFLLGLLLLSQSLSQLVKVVTAFTIAHSVTLALAANGWVTPPGIWVEPAIALTIAYVGLLGLVGRQSRHGVWLASGFGLVHGFGFAGALAETLAQQPPGRGSWLLSLASFNLGIEAFQISLVSVVVPLMLFAARFPWYRLAQRMASFLVLGAGLSWAFTRGIGILQ